MPISLLELVLGKFAHYGLDLFSAMTSNSLVVCVVVMWHSGVPALECHALKVQLARDGPQTSLLG